MKEITIINVFAILLAIAVLIVSGVGTVLDRYSSILFAIPMVLLSVDSVLLFQMKKIYYSLTTLIVILVLLACSFMPWYGKHVGEPSERSTHRHSIWEIDHVH